MRIRIKVKLVCSICLLISALCAHAAFAKSDAILRAVRFKKTEAHVEEMHFMLSRKVPGQLRNLPAKRQVIIDFWHAETTVKPHLPAFMLPMLQKVELRRLEAGHLQWVMHVAPKIHALVSERPGSALANQTIVVTFQSDSPMRQPKAASFSKPRTLNDLKKVERNEKHEKRARHENHEQHERHERYEKRDVFKPAPIATPASNMVFWQRPLRVILDPGHGGHDSGAVSAHGLQEKQVVLMLSKRIAYYLNQHPKVRATLTRSHDVYLPLRKRLALARAFKADLFIAVHADAHFNKAAKGVSVFALSKRGATSEAARWLARRENYSELGEIEFNHLKDRSTAVRKVLIDLAQTATIRDSVRLGMSVLGAVKPISHLHYTHVEQAPFVVLKSPDIPSILLESGFITNQVEAERLATPHYREQLAEAIAKGVLDYYHRYTVTMVRE